MRTVITVHNYLANHMRAVVDALEVCRKKRECGIECRWIADPKWFENAVVNHVPPSEESRSRGRARSADMIVHERDT